MQSTTQRILMLEAPFRVNFSDVPLRPLAADDVLFKSRYSTFKHGTEMLAYFGRNPFATRTFDQDLRLFEPKNANGEYYPRPMGNMVIGEVLSVGSNVENLRPGQLIFTWAPVADVHVMPAETVHPLGDLDAQQALCIDPASFALGGLIDGGIEKTDTVLITGLGAIGLFAVQYCKAIGATTFATSRFEIRRKLAETYGATHVLDPNSSGDLARFIKELTGGVDVAIECSGSPSNLNDAIRATRQCGRVVCIGFYGSDASGLNLGEEFFHNRITLLASLPAVRWNNPVRSKPPIYPKDLQKRTVEDLRQGKITPNGILHPSVPFRAAEEAVRLIADAPDRVVKVLITHD